MKKSLLILMLIPLFIFAQEESSINFQNTERNDHNNIDGLLYYDLNFYPDYADVTGGDGGGLSIYNAENGWGAVIATNNMQWITPTFNGGIFNGNVGVGTTSPNSKLDVNGEIKGNSLRLLNSNSIYKEGFGFGINTDRGYLFRQSWLSGVGDYVEINNLNASGGGERVDYIFRISGRDGFQFMPRNVEAMRITKDGNVGIGTTTPDSKLTVAGKIHSQEVKVTVNAGADFVFEDDYNLPKLENVQEFINKNGHLPEIASAKDMEENGIHLSEMNIKLLQKIEELTLYIIEQEKKLENLEVLEDKVTKLESLVEQLINIQK